MLLLRAVIRRTAWHRRPGRPNSWGVHTVAVTDLTAARKLVEAVAIATSTTPEGFHVTADDACGVPVAFAQS
ncbi:hypothetical protein [Nonomuraea sp. NPDC003201]